MNVTDKNGLQWSNGGEETDDHLAWGGHEPGLINIGKALMKEDGVFLDIGAHVGLWSLNLGLKAGSVYSIEANAQTYGTLIKNIDRNEALLGNTLFFPHFFAAWDCHEMLDLVDPNGKKTGGSTQCVPGGSQVWGYTLDSVLPHCRPDLVKIDVEGAEGRVLRGMRKMLAANQPTLIIEMHDRLLQEPSIRADVYNELEMHGYTFTDDTEFGAAYYVIAQPREFKPEFEIEVVKAGDNPAFHVEDEEAVRNVYDEAMKTTKETPA